MALTLNNRAEAMYTNWTNYFGACDEKDLTTTIDFTMHFGKQFVQCFVWMQNVI